MNKVFLIWLDYDVTLLPKTQTTNGMQQSLMDSRGLTRPIQMAQSWSLVFEKHSNHMVHCDSLG